MPTHPQINWHRNPVAQRIIARLHTGNTEWQTRVSIPCDYRVLVGTTQQACDAITALEAIREVSIDEALGYAFTDTNTDKTLTRRVAYLQAMDRAPEVTTVLDEAFADREGEARAAMSYVPGSVAA